MNEINRNRRIFLKSSAGAAATVGTAGAAVLPGTAHAAPLPTVASTTLSYPKKELGKATVMKVNQVVAFNYPDASSPCLALRLGSPVPGGVGPHQDIVAFSAMCTHMGCALRYDGATRTLKCGCHFTIFDPEQGGQMVCGQATEDLPRVVLDYDARTDTVTAVGLDGLLYGRQANLL